MSASMWHSNDPMFWLGAMSSAVGGYLNRMQTDESLRKVYRDFVRSPACEDELRAVLPPVPPMIRKPPARVKGRRR